MVKDRGKQPKPPKPTDRPASPRSKKLGTAAPKRTVHAIINEINQGDENSRKCSEEIRTASDRGAALLAVCQIDQGLELSIICRLHHASMKTREMLRKPNGAFSSFMGKIDLAYAFGIYNEKYRDTLHIVRTIRNGFAHAAIPLTFEDDGIISECRRVNNGVIFPSFPEKAYKAPEGYENHSFSRYIFVRSCLNAHDSLMSNARGYIDAIEKAGRIIIEEL